MADREENVELEVDAARLLEAARQAPSLHAGRLDALRRAVQDGTYRVPTADLARAVGEVARDPGEERW